eukprot:COSAG06_NODE_818_length_12113_cov_9.211670_7_plen_219_part_00
MLEISLPASQPGPAAARPLLPDCALTLVPGGGAAMAELKIIGGAAFRTFRNLWMLEELGVPYTHVPAMPRSADATASNPFGKIPSLVDGGFTMHESAAINTYLGDKFRGREGCADLVPAAGTIERGRYEQQVMVVMAELDAQGLWIHRKHEALGQIFGEIPPAVAHAKQHVSKVIEVLEADLRSDGPYLCGSAFSAAVSSQPASAAADSHEPHRGLCS